MKIFNFEVVITHPKAPIDKLPGLYDHTLQATRIALFEVRLEVESSQARELTLMKRLQRLEQEQATFPEAGKIQIVRK